LHDKLLVYDELDALKIEVLGQTQRKIKAQLARLYSCIANETEIKTSILVEWFTKKDIDESIQDKFFEEFNTESYLTIIDDVSFNHPAEEGDFDFLYDLLDDDLDSLLDDDGFIDEVDSVEDAVDKYRNIEYIIQLEKDDETKSNKALENLIEANSRLVWKTVSYYSGLSTIGFDAEDMYQIGMEGLMKAA